MQWFQEVYMVDLLALPAVRLMHSVVDWAHLFYNFIGSQPPGQEFGFIRWD